MGSHVAMNPYYSQHRLVLILYRALSSQNNKTKNELEWVLGHAHSEARTWNVVFG